MERQVDIKGRGVKLYRVNGYDNAWCSDPQLARQIGHRRQELLRELKSSAQDIVNLTEQDFFNEQMPEENAA